MAKKKVVHHHKTSLNGVRIGIALGALCSVYLGLLGLVAKWFGWGGALVRTIGSLYIGFDSTCFGIFKGMIWVFIDCFIAGWIFAWIYNNMDKVKFLKKFIK